jgi:hypothetical protein
MGEQGLLALRDAARAGSLAAVDDIAAIATPAAIEILVDFIWADTNIAARAAWLLAHLFGDPTAERELLACNLPVVAEARRLDWVWAPFRRDSAPAVQQLAGRVAYLMSVTTEQAALEGLEIDKRFIIPLGIVNGCEQVKERRVERPPEQLVADVDMLLSAGPGRRKSTERLAQWSGLASVCLGVPPKLDSAQARAVLNAVIAARGLPTPALRIINCLGVADLATVAATIFCKPTLRVTRTHWQRVNVKDLNPQHLRAVQIFLGAALVVLVGVSSVFAAAGEAFGVWEVGPRWLSLCYLALVALAVPLVISEGVEGSRIRESNSIVVRFGHWLNDQLLRLSDRRRLSLAFVLFLGCLGAFAIFWFSATLLTLVAVLPFVLGVGGCVVVFASFSIWLRIAEDRWRNPLRDVLRSESPSSGHAQSIISDH